MKKLIIPAIALFSAQLTHAQESTVKVEGLQTQTTEQSSMAAPAPAPTSVSSETSNSTKSKLSDVLKNKKFEDDNKITDAKLKAEGGSLSKYSMKFNIGYSGPPTTNMDSSYQPNPDTSRKPKKVLLSGSLGGKYRIDSGTSVNAGTGVTSNDPAHGSPEYNMNDPFIGYNILSRVNGIQMSHYFKVARVTTPIYTSVGEDGSVSYDNWLVYDLGTSRLALEFDTGVGYYFYNRGANMAAKGRDLKAEITASRYSVTFIPILKYRFTDKLNVETSVSFSYTNYRSTTDNTLWNQSLSTQRLGIGYAITRDIYINPYISFYPDQFSPDYTAFNISTTFSLL